MMSTYMQGASPCETDGQFLPSTDIYQSAVSLVVTTTEVSATPNQALATRSNTATPRHLNSQTLPLPQHLLVVKYAQPPGCLKSTAALPSCSGQAFVFAACPRASQVQQSQCKSLLLLTAWCHWVSGQSVLLLPTN